MLRKLCCLSILGRQLFVISLLAIVVGGMVAWSLGYSRCAAAPYGLFTEIVDFMKSNGHSVYDLQSRVGQLTKLLQGHYNEILDNELRKQQLLPSQYEVISNAVDLWRDKYVAVDQEVERLKKLLRETLDQCRNVLTTEAATGEDEFKPKFYDHLVT